MALPPNVLTVEDGSGVAGADTFITVAELDEICLFYFDHTATGGVATKNGAIRRSWVYLKSLPWKAEYPFPTLGGTIPDDVKLAQGILAHFEKETPSGLQPNVVPGQQKILTRVGEIGWTATGQTGTDAQRAVVTMAADLLKPYLQAKTNFLLRG
jgi:hypothetical protein